MKSEDIDIDELIEVPQADGSMMKKRMGECTWSDLEAALAYRDAQIAAESITQFFTVRNMVSEMVDEQLNQRIRDGKTIVRKGPEGKDLYINVEYATGDDWKAFEEWRKDNPGIWEQP